MSQFPVDLTMLAWPGWRGMLAQRRWKARYPANFAWFLELSTKRHQAWIARGCKLKLAISVRDPKEVSHTYVDATCSAHNLHVDDKGHCPRC